MADEMDAVGLRQLVEAAVRSIATYSHRELDEYLPRLGLSDGKPGSRAERVNNALAALQDADLIESARRVLAVNSQGVHVRTRFDLEEGLWSMAGTIQISMRVRREIAKGLDDAPVSLVHDSERFMAVLDDLWVLDDDPFGAWGGFFASEEGLRQSLRGRVMQHYLRNDDLPTEQLFEELGAYKAGDRRFALFLERLVAPSALPDEPAQRAVVETVNPHLKRAGAELLEVGEDGGYPVFAVVPTGTARNRNPKTLVFASMKKPDIRLRSVVDHDIEILGNADDYLVYDRPLTADGIRWRDLQAWWKDLRQIGDDQEAKWSLYNRLLGCLPRDSPPQQNLYKIYHHIYGTRVYDLPALLPEVWLLWDWKNRSQRTLDAMSAMRMDFLLLLTDEYRALAVLQPFFAGLFRRYLVSVPA